jgi:hypothetical protein
MKTVNLSAQEIQITSVYFRQNPSQIRFESFPRRLTYKGREYILAET